MMAMASRGGGLHLPISMARALVMEGGVDDQGSDLIDTWVKLHGVPPPYRHTNRLLIGTRALGRPVDVADLHLKWQDPYV